MVEITPIIHPGAWYFFTGIATTSGNNTLSPNKRNMIAISLLCFSLVFEW